MGKIYADPGVGAAGPCPPFWRFPKNKEKRKGRKEKEEKKRKERKNNKKQTKKKRNDNGRKKQRNKQSSGL